MGKGWEGGGRGDFVEAERMECGLTWGGGGETTAVREGWGGEEEGVRWAQCIK